MDDNLNLKILIESMQKGHINAVYLSEKQFYVNGTLLTIDRGALIGPGFKHVYFNSAGILNILLYENIVEMRTGQKNWICSEYSIQTL